MLVFAQDFSVRIFRLISTGGRACKMLTTVRSPSPLLERGRRDPARIILVRPFIQTFILDRGFQSTCYAPPIKNSLAKFRRAHISWITRHWIYRSLGGAKWSRLVHCNILFRGGKSAIAD